MWHQTQVLITAVMTNDLPSHVLPRELNVILWWMKTCNLTLCRFVPFHFTWMVMTRTHKTSMTWFMVMTALWCSSSVTMSFTLLCNSMLCYVLSWRFMPNDKTVSCQHCVIFDVMTAYNSCSVEKYTSDALSFSQCRKCRITMCHVCHPMNYIPHCANSHPE